MDPATLLNDTAAFGYGLTTQDVEELRTILREDCNEDVSLEEAWSRAAALLALTQVLLEFPHAETREAAGAELELRPT